YSRKERESTAWHEAGHALLQLLVKHADPLHKVTIIPRGRALGATMSLPEKDILNRTKNYFLDEMVVCCGGRIAEEIFTGDISTGAAQDIAQATEIARDMVCRYGMSGRFGFQAFSEQSRWTADPLPPALSEHTRRALDDEVSRLVGEAYERAEKLLKRNRDRLELIAKTLIEKETMDGAEVRAIAGIDESKPDEAEDDVK
ncbi:MAG: cell division protein FtsH, partial [Kiritimatiellae bacterium]|nr:cell division protein FtsH [Kiritimatiellia bacterium]